MHTITQHTYIHMTLTHAASNHELVVYNVVLAVYIYDIVRVHMSRDVVTTWLLEGEHMNLGG